MSTTLEIIDGEAKRRIGIAVFDWIPDADFDILDIDGALFAVVGHARKAIFVKGVAGEVPSTTRILWTVRLDSKWPCKPRFRSKRQPNEFVAPPKVPARRSYQWRPPAPPDPETSEKGAEV